MEKNSKKTSLFKFSVYISFTILILISWNTNAQIDSFRKKIDGILGEIDAVTGVALLHSKLADTILFNNDYLYPMQSVYKFPLALAVLAQVEKGIFTLDQKVHITQADLLPNTWSPIREKYRDSQVDLTIAELIEFTVSQSDNNSCDILFRLLGGPESVNEYIHSLGIENVEIAATEQEMHESWEVQFTNVCKPSAMLELLISFYERKILSESSTSYLWKIMCRTTTGSDRIKGLLPDGTVVAHKTGSSGANDMGVTAAVNDVGIVMFPDDSFYAIVVFVSNTKATATECERIIAEISRAAWDFYSENDQ